MAIENEVKVEFFFVAGDHGDKRAVFVVDRRDYPDEASAERDSLEAQDLLAGVLIQTETHWVSAAAGRSGLPGWREFKRDW